MIVHNNLLYNVYHKKPRIKIHIAKTKAEKQIAAWATHMAT